MTEVLQGTNPAAVHHRQCVSSRLKTVVIREGRGLPTRIGLSVRPTVEVCLLVHLMFVSGLDNQVYQVHGPGMVMKDER